MGVGGFVGSHGFEGWWGYVVLVNPEASIFRGDNWWNTSSLVQFGRAGSAEQSTEYLLGKTSNGIAVCTSEI